MNSFAGIEAFIIHLARAKARRPQVDRIVASCPVPARILDAVDGRALSDAEVDAVYSPKSLFVPSYPFAIAAGEIGCFLSHRKAWQAILDTGLEAGLIIEDDVEIEPEMFASALQLASEEVQKRGYIQFQVRPVHGKAQILAASGQTTIVQPRVGMLRTSGQLVSAAHARHLLEITARFDRPIDTLLQMSWVTGVALSCAVPSGLSDRTQQSGGSTIALKTKRTWSQTLLREIRRFTYRSRIKAHSNRYFARNGVE